jgi:hypothetical protein
MTICRSLNSNSQMGIARRGELRFAKFTDADKLIDKLTELVSGGFFFEHPRRIPIAILVMTVIVARWYYRYL